MKAHIKPMKLRVLHQRLHRDPTTRLFLRTLWVLLQSPAPMLPVIYRQQINLHLNTPRTGRTQVCAGWNLSWWYLISNLRIESQYNLGTPQPEDTPYERVKRPHFCLILQLIRMRNPAIPTLWICIPTRNRSTHLANCLSSHISAQAQSVNSVQVCLSDKYSSDNPASIVH